MRRKRRAHSANPLTAGRLVFCETPEKNPAMLSRLLILAASLLPILTAPAEPPTASIGKLANQKPDEHGRMEMVKVQIALDRAGFRPGKIDGLGGEFTQKAADRYCTAYSLPEGSRIDTSGIAQPYRDYTITGEDVSWIGDMKSKPEEQEKLKRLPYRDTWELVAEKFHTDLDFVRELNPTLTEPPAEGQTVRVPDVEPFDMQAVAELEKTRRAESKKKSEDSEAASPTPTPAYEPERKLVLLREPRLIELYEDGKLTGCFPCTPGSSEQPVPPGNYKITSNTLLPYFRWDKSVLETGKRSDEAYNLPPGPNNPVGIVWLAINIPSRGMHGTPWPDQIGRNESHGCIRLANWDAWVLAQKIKKGTPVEVR
jgi:lipoprotein-anchoring transpeptidase ErfK/SrfK